MTTENPTTRTDWRGNEYTIGDRVLYPRTSGRSCEMQEGRVTKFNYNKDGRLTSVGVMPTRSSRAFGRWDIKPVSITITDNITRVMEPEQVLALPVQEQSELVGHLKQTHGALAAIKAVEKHMKKMSGEKYGWYSHRATPEQIAEYNRLIAEAHEQAHQHEQDGLVHSHDPLLRTHDFEERVERTEQRTRVIGWKNKTTGHVMDREQYQAVTRYSYGFDNTPPDYQSRQRHQYRYSRPYIDSYGRRQEPTPWVSEWEKVTEEYTYEFKAHFCHWCDVKMNQKNHGPRADVVDTICAKNNAPIEEPA